jgi:small-conductance mechanosensitive channel
VDPKPPTRLATTGYVVVTALLVAMLVAGVVLTATAVVGAVRRGQTITVDRVIEPQHLTSLPADVKPTNDVPVTVTIRDARPGQLFLRLAIDLLSVLLIVALLWQLWGLLRSARKGDPFTTANVWRLRQFGWLLLLGWPLVAYVTFALKEFLAMTPPADQTGGHFAPPIGLALLFGLAVLILAEVFAHGLRLREDVEGTI